ncbi:MAG: ABC transporter substrate-binding protein [Chloroflexi bacterium]|nr:ABC transporter substrate-binding protein [Chloroflexota bacterium]
MPANHPYNIIRLGRRPLLRGALAMAAATGLAACGGPDSSSSRPATTAATGGPAAAGTIPPPATTGPTNATAVMAVSRNLVNGETDPFFMHTSLMCHEPLIALDDSLAPIPALAERWSLSDDGLKWTFTLRKGVTFSDGEPFNAQAVAANVQRNIKISPRTSSFFTLNAKDAYGPLDEVRAVDDTTVEFRHTAPYPIMEATMTNFFSAMYSPKSFTDSGDFKAIPGTTGPFKLTSWQIDQFAVLERNDAYWGPKPPLRQIRLRIIPDPNTRVSALIAGEVEAVVELGALLPAQAQQLRSRSDMKVGADPISITQFLTFNCGKPPFNDMRLRQAIVRSFDRETVVRELVLGFAEPGKSLLSPFSKRWFSPKGTPKFDPAEGRALAQAALGGQRVEVVLPFSTTTGQARPYKEIAEYMQATLRPLGFDLKLQQLEAAALTDVTTKGEWHLRMSQNGWANGDADFLLSNWIASTGGINTTSNGAYKNEEADRLIAQGRSERDYQKRFAIYERVQEIAATEVPSIAMYHEFAPYAYRTTLTGLRQRITYQPTLESIARV